MIGAKICLSSAVVVMQAQSEAGEPDVDAAPQHLVGDSGCSRRQPRASTPNITLVITPMNIVWSNARSSPSCDSVSASKSTTSRTIHDTRTVSKAR